MLKEKRARRVSAETVDEGAAGKARPWSEIMALVAAGSSVPVHELDRSSAFGNALPWPEVLRKIEAGERSAR